MRRLQSNYRSSDLFQAKALLILFCLLGVVFSVRAQEVNLKVTDRLTDAEVQAAITKGLHEKPWEIGLSMQQHHFMGLFFSITVYWPGAWIEYLAFEAHRQLKPFTAADVTDAMRARVIVVQANPSVPTEIQYTSEAENVSHVVLQDVGKASVIQPLSEESFTNTYSAPVGNPLQLSGKHDIFFYDAVMDLCSGKPEGCKFIVTIIGEYRRKDFEVSGNDLLKR